ncbi:MAG: hypothetical protein AAFP67_02440 [Pseudomonadota bacterium]
MSDGLFLDNPTPSEALVAELKALERKAIDDASLGAVSTASEHS